MSTPNSYAHAFALLKSGTDGDVRAGLAVFEALVRERPGDAKARFEYAGALDYLEREAEAVREYDAVYREGMTALAPDDRMRLHVQLGSTLRNLGQYDRSAEILSEGLRRFPGASALRAFLALTRYSSGDRRGALREALGVLLDPAADDSVAEYRRALAAYAEELEP
jgi:tetratricopeptide (TPR) repeat protein